MQFLKEISITTNGEGFYSVTRQIQSELDENLSGSLDGVLTVFTPHTSCALTINENYDPLAQEDMENFLKHLAPRNLAFIKHDDEGEDDSPSHMKSILLNPSLSIIISNGKMLLGTWQGLFLTEFRDAPKERTLYLKFQADA